MRVHQRNFDLIFVDYYTNIPRFSDCNLAPSQPYGFQIAASKHKGNLILGAPTGSGKTEAALLWAQLNQQYNGRLFYALPTMASINAMYLRLCETFCKEGAKKFSENGKQQQQLVGLLHSRTVSSLYSMFEVDDNGSNAKVRQAKARSMASLV
ncbi:MAG: DEAD/DEAH box helicase [Candidatus Nitrosopolaris sp.]